MAQAVSSAAITVLTDTQLAEVQAAVQIPALYVNHFSIAGAPPGIVRMSLGESPDGKTMSFRGAFAMTADAALLLAKILVDTAEQVKAATKL
ncbi:MAG TPA: hypothetical protein VK803_10150 [Steroidobacteraceae bacterium]|jgi:hypothetical protein|nr:hypothetical protein [Steroidobacteraceae bacterium]